MRHALLVVSVLACAVPVSGAAAPSFRDAGSAVVAVLWIHPDAPDRYSAFFGAITAGGTVVTVAHGLAHARPGDAVWVALSGFHAVAVGPVPDPLPQAYWRGGVIRALCPAVDVARIAVRALPRGVRPLRMSAAIPDTLHVLNIGPRGTLQVTRASRTGGEFPEPLGQITRPQPAIALDAVRARDGWSGSPIVTSRGDLAGLLISATTLRDTTAGFAPASWLEECR